MLRRVIKPIFFLPLALCINSLNTQNLLSSETKDYIEGEIIDKKDKREDDV